MQKIARPNLAIERRRSGCGPGWGANLAPAGVKSAKLLPLGAVASSMRYRPVPPATFSLPGGGSFRYKP